MLTAKNTKILILIFGIVLFIGAILYNRFAVNRFAVKHIEPNLSNEFNNENLNLIKIDTIENLLNKTYGSQITIKHSNSLMEIILTANENILKDFYNGNEALLKYSLNDYNFELIKEENKQQLKGRFKIKDGGIFIPNDILIRLIEKNYN